VVEGGAQYALQRMFASGVPWPAALLLPPTDGDGVYADRGAVPVRRTGVLQPSGVSAGGVRVVGATARLVAQALATRVHPAFRSADIVDANTARSAAFGALAAWSARVPFVIHLRDMIAPDALGSAGYALMTRVALPRADAVVGDTRATLASAAPFLRADARTIVIASASGLRRSPATRERPPGPLRVGMLARVDPWKGQAVLLEAFARAFGDADAVLEIAGGAPFGHDAFLRELEARAGEIGIRDRVRFLGHVDDVDAVLARWDIAVHASTRPEPLGQNVLQYLAAGIATIVADEGGPTEFVDDDVNGLRVTPRDAGLLAEALTRLAADDALRARLGRAAAVTPGLLTDAEVVAAHDEFYRSLSTRRTRRRVLGDARVGRLRG
jgi:glycosyltransferase involved in cell wall biosynthesis